MVNVYNNEMFLEVLNPIYIWQVWLSSTPIALEDENK